MLGIYGDVQVDLDPNPDLVDLNVFSEGMLFSL